MREITLDERDYQNPSELMAYLQEALSFPDYFGGNLPALNDCLGDICSKTRITIIRRDMRPNTWFDKVTTTIMRAALKNDALSVRIR